MKKRLDMLMMERALAPSREKAKAFIMAGDVYVDGQKEDKAGTMFPETVKIEVRGNTLPYVSRGGLKLEKAMKNFDVTLKKNQGSTNWLPVLWNFRKAKIQSAVQALPVPWHMGQKLP